MYICHCLVTQSCPTLCNPMDCDTPGFPVLRISWSLLRLMSIDSVMSSNHLILCRLLLLLPQSFLASGSFPVSQFFASGGHSIGASASASVLPVNTQGWFPLGWTGLISLQSKGLARVFSSTRIRKQKKKIFLIVSVREESYRLHTWPSLCSWRIRWLDGEWSRVGALWKS